MKTLREDRTAAERKMSLVRPAAGGESCKAGFFAEMFGQTGMSGGEKFGSEERLL